MLHHHCAKFRAWTSISLNPSNAQQQGCLFSESNSNQLSWLHPSIPDTWSPSLLCPDGISPPAYHSLIPDSQETNPYVRISNAFWCSCCIQGFWKQSAYWWQVLHGSWPCCCQESSSQPEQKPSMLPVPLHSLSFQTQDLWWADGFEAHQRCQLSTSLWLILEKHGTSKWSSHHPCLELWQTV